MNQSNISSQLTNGNAGSLRSEHGNPHSLRSNQSHKYEVQDHHEFGAFPQKNVRSFASRAFNGEFSAEHGGAA